MSPKPSTRARIAQVKADIDRAPGGVALIARAASSPSSSPASAWTSPFHMIASEKMR